MYRHARVSLINLLFSELFKALKRFFEWLFVLAVFAACTSQPKQTPLEAAMLQHGKALMLEHGVSDSKDWSLSWDTLTEAGSMKRKADYVAIAASMPCSIGPTQDTATCNRIKNLRDSLLAIASTMDSTKPVMYSCNYVLRHGAKNHSVNYFVDANNRLVRYKDFYDDHGFTILTQQTGYSEF